MTFDGIITKCIVNELSTKLTNGKVERITMPNKNEIYIYVYNAINKGKYIICINCNANEARINITAHSKPLALTPPTFCMVARKHLQNARITDISQYMSDRIIQIQFEGYNELNDLETKHLFIELMGKHSNCILVNNNLKIIDSMKHIDNSISSVRLVLPGVNYEYPKTKIDFTAVSFDDFKNVLLDLDNTSSISSGLSASFNGFSNVFIQNVLNDLNINLNCTIQDLSKETIESIYKHISNIYSNIQTGIFDIKDVNTKSMYINTNSMPENSNISISKYIDDYYNNFNTNILFNEAKNNLLRVINSVISKDSKNLKIVNNILSECEKVDTYRIYGELINSNLHIHNDNSDYLVVQNYYDNNNEIHIPLDKTISLPKNAQKYFKKYGKLKKAYTYNISEKEKLENEIKYLESVIYSIESSNDITELELIKKELIMEKYISDKKQRNNKQNSSKPKQENTISPLKYMYNDYEIYVGKNNIQNNYLTHKFAKSNDIWLHTQAFHGSHVIIKNTSNKEIPDDVIEFAANLASFYSKASSSNKVLVDYCYIKYVKKHPSNMMGMVIYTNFKSINSTPTEYKEYICN